MPPSTSCTGRRIDGEPAPTRTETDPPGSPGNTAPAPWEPTSVETGGEHRLGGFGDFVRAQAAGADADTADAAVNQRANNLQVRLETAGTHVVRVADCSADDGLPPHISQLWPLLPPEGTGHYSRHGMMSDEAGAAGCLGLLRSGRIGGVSTRAAQVLQQFAGTRVRVGARRRRRPSSLAPCSMRRSAIAASRSIAEPAFFTTSATTGFSSAISRDAASDAG